MTWDIQSTYNTIGLSISVVLLIGYHVWLYHTFSKSPASTVYGLMSSGRRVFIASIIHRKTEILAVQTLRNWVMMSSVLLQTSVIIIFGLVAFLSTILTKDTSSSTPLTQDQDGWFTIKIVILVATFMFAFFFFAQAMRFFNHTAIIVNTNIDEEELEKLDKRAESAYRTLNPNMVSDVFNRGTFYNTAGLRMYYLSFPQVAWLGGPWFLLGATVLLLFVLRSVDFLSYTTKLASPPSHTRHSLDEETTREESHSKTNQQEQEQQQQRARNDREFQLSVLSD